MSMSTQADFQYAEPGLSIQAPSSSLKGRLAFSSLTNVVANICPAVLTTATPPPLNPLGLASLARAVRLTGGSPRALRPRILGHGALTADAGRMRRTAFPTSGPLA